MLPLFKRKRKKPELTFKSRVAEFWDWYAQNAPRFYETIEAMQCGDLYKETAAAMERLVPDAAWMFGPGPGGQGHSLTFTAEGNPYIQLLTMEWAEHAPSLTGWTFHPFKQANPEFAEASLGLDDLVFKPEEFWITPHVDAQDEIVDLTVWHPAFDRMKREHCARPVFIFLELALGEIVIQEIIGDIKIGQGRLTEAMALTEFPEFMQRVMREQEWESKVPGESWNTYSTREPVRGALRRDIIGGSTRLKSLISDLEDGRLDPDPLENTGADLMYVAFPSSHLPSGAEVASRGVIEDGLESALEADSSGQLLGGAHGIEHAYIDLLLFDGENSLRIVRDVLRKQQLPAQTRIEYFSKSRAGEGALI